MNKLGVAHCDLLGGFRLFDRNGAEFRLPIVKGAAIIVYLCSRSGHEASRGELCGLLWGDKPEATARTALRQCLHQMRSKLSEFEPNFLTFASNSVRLDRSMLSLDTDVLVNADRIMDLPHPSEIRVDQYLLGFEDLDPTFSDWLWTERAKLDERFRATLRTILDNPKADHRHKRRAAQHLNFVDPSQEVAARFLIEEAASDNDLVSILRVYRKLWDSLSEEWGEEPSGDLQEFVGLTRARLGDVANATEVGPDVTPIRKYVSVLAISIDAEAARPATVDAQVSKANKAISSLNGTLLNSSSSGLCGVFGLERASENSARDAVEAALALKKLLSRELQLRIGYGIDTGYVLAKPAEATHEHPEISGSVLGQAMALANSDGASSISATSRTMYGIEGIYRVERDPDQETSKSPIVRVLGRNSAARFDTFRGKRATFVGRAPFLAALWEIWTEALGTSSLQIASIQGPAGVGKTRLADEFMRRVAAEGMCTARAACDRYDRSSILEPLYELLRALKAAPEASAERTGMFEEVDRKHSIDAIVEELSSALRLGPAAIFIDDWQWADDATRLAISRLVTSGSQAPLLLVLTSRNIPADEWLVTNSTQFVLPNFTAKEVVERAELLLDRPIDEALRQQILAKSGGNPLLLEEVCYAIESSPSGLPKDEVIVDLPANLQGLFASRFERLEQDERAVLFAVAAHGDYVQNTLLSKVLGGQVAPQVIRRLNQKDILATTATESIRFKHSLARDVIYNMIPEEQRHSLHRSYIECLRADMRPEDEHQLVEALAFHYRGCGDVANALEFSEKSGDKALKASALDQAIRHYGLALDLVDQLPMDETIRKRWVSLAIRWAIPTTYAPSYEQLPLLERAELMAKQIGDLHSAATLRYWIGYFAYVLGEKDQPLKSFQVAKDVADAIGSVRLSVEITAIEGCLLASVARYDEAEAAMREALAIKDRHPGKGDRAPVTSVYTRANLALVCAERGNFDTAQSLINEALSRVRGFEHEVESSILLFSGTINLWRGAWSAALDDASKSRERSEKVSSLYLMGMSRCIWGYAHWKLHRSALGLDTLVRNARWMRDRGMGMYYSIICGWLADVLAEAGHHDNAEAAYLDAQERASCGEIAGLAMACRATAFSAILNGQFDAASARLGEASAIAKRRVAAHEVAANNLMYARFYHAQNKRTEAIASVDAAKTAYLNLGLDHRYRMSCEVEAMVSG